MIEVFQDDNRLCLIYSAEQRDPAWIEETLEKEGAVTLSRCFTFKEEHGIASQSRLKPSDCRWFLLGENIDGYYVIDKNILKLKYDLLLSAGMRIKKRTFLATGKSSIFKKIDSIVEQQIVIGGDGENAVPEHEFNRLLDLFPTATTLLHFSHSRISGILKEYFETMTDARRKLEEHFERQKLKANKTPSLDSIKASTILEPFRKYEIAKYRYILESIEDMLNEPDTYTEQAWQKKILECILLIFPKYVAVLGNLHIRDFYSSPGAPRNRYIDLTLVDADGNIDIIEIKKPFPSCILYAADYRDNFVPKKELSGSVMQVEKYIFHLNKWGVDGERRINEKRGHELPGGIQIRITNPKGVIILGRDGDFTGAQKFDFEIIKRKYANIADIMTYDDLLNRLRNIISKFENGT